MRPFPAIFTVALLGLAAFIGGAIGMTSDLIKPAPAVAAVLPNVDTTVRLEIDGMGVCSGVHIGNGFILTAGHCTDGAHEIVVVDAAGRRYETDILWGSGNGDNKSWDVALLYAGKNIDDHPGITYGEAHAAAKLSCAPNYVGQSIVVVGNPNGEYFLYSWGHVSGTGQMKAEAGWRDLSAMDITIAGGNSGGPVFNDKGEVVGIAVAGYNNAPIAFMVPGADVCHVMGSVA